MLGFRREDIVWSLRPEYAQHSWHGTKDPLAVALNALADGRWCGVESGSGTGKTITLGAGLTLWFLAAWENARVFSLAPRERQLQDNMWREITKLFPRFKKLFPQADLTSLTIRMRGGIDNTWGAEGMSAQVGADETVAGTTRGYHEAHQLIIFEEGPGIHDAIWNTMQSTSGGSHNLILGLGNPDSVHDPLHRFCMRSRVEHVRISCFDYPNVVCDNPELIPGATTRQWIADRAEVWGEGSNNYQRFVEGIAPAQADDSLILLEWCEAAAKRWGDKELREGPLALGVDPADDPRGDASAFSFWQGACCTQVVEMRLEDASLVGQEVVKLIRNPDGPIDPKRVGIDNVGIGTSTINEIKRHGIRVKHISGGSRAGPFTDIEAEPEEGKRHIVVETAQYDNLRSQVYVRLAEDLRLQRIALPNDPELFRQLTAHTVRDLPTSKKRSVSPKDEVKAKLRRSPDKADAVAYGNWVRFRRIPKVDVTEEQQKPMRGRTDDHLERLLERQARENRAILSEHRRMLRSLTRKRT